MASYSFRWDGVTQSSIYNPNYIRARVKMFDDIHKSDWDAVLAACRDYNALTQFTELDSDEQYTLLHYAALNTVSEAIVHELIELGAYRSLPSADGKLPVDLLPSDIPDNIRDLLQPIPHEKISYELLGKLEAQFHQLLRENLGDLLEKNQLRLPPLAPLLETEILQGNFVVSGFYGGVVFKLILDEDVPYLVCHSSSRVIGYSGRLYKITANEAVLLSSESDNDREHHQMYKKYF